MSAEFDAQKARELTENKDQINAEKWYVHWKDNFYAAVRKEALNGKNSISLESGEWLENEHNKKYLTSKLSALGYKIEISDWHDYESITVSW